jgi:hypothetical protein
MPIMIDAAVSLTDLKSIAFPFPIKFPRYVTLELMLFFKKLLLIVAVDKSNYLFDEPFFQMASYSSAARRWAILSWFSQ